MFFPGPPELGCRQTARNARIGGPDSCEVYPNTQPWMVALYMGRKQTITCGGSVISRNIVLTAGHCLCLHKRQLIPMPDCKSKEIWKKARFKYIKVGDHDQTTSQGEYGEQKIEILHFIPHENYTGNI